MVPSAFETLCHHLGISGVPRDKLAIASLDLLAGAISIGSVTYEHVRIAIPDGEAAVPPQSDMEDEGGSARKDNGARKSRRHRKAYFLRLMMELQEISKTHELFPDFLKDLMERVDQQMANVRGYPGERQNREAAVKDALRQMIHNKKIPAPSVPPKWFV